MEKKELKDINEAREYEQKLKTEEENKRQKEMLENKLFNDVQLKVAELNSAIKNYEEQTGKTLGIYQDTRLEKKGVIIKRFDLNTMINNIFNYKG